MFYVLPFHISLNTNLISPAASELIFHKRIFLIKY